MLGAALRFSALVHTGRGDEAQRAKVAAWTDILEHLAPLPLTTTGDAEVWVWAETNVSSSAAFGVNQWCAAPRTPLLLILQGIALLPF